MNKTAKIDWDNGTVTVAKQADGTFLVSVGGVPVGRWPNMAMAERNAESIRSHQPAKR